LKGYDSHHIIKALTADDAKNVNVIASSMEKFISFEIDGLRFVDTLQFLNASLDSLVKVLGKDGVDKFVYTHRHFSDEI
jgi:hypothetical protein